MGYFKVPRDAGLDTVAETLDISTKHSQNASAGPTRR